MSLPKANKLILVFPMTISLYSNDKMEKWMRTLANFIFVIVCSVNFAAAEAVKLTGDEIRELLTGNTAFGRMDGKKYRQWFGENDVAMLAMEGSDITSGGWRIDDIAKELQTNWGSDGQWNGLYVMEFGNTYYWVSKVTPPTPFQVVVGKKLVTN